jgi:hypothetical protein
MDLLGLIDSDDDHNKDQKESRKRSKLLKSGKQIKRGSVTILPSSQAPADLFVRSVPHKQGHWSGHVRVPIDFSSSVKSLIDDDLIDLTVRGFQKRLELSGVTGTLIRHESIHFSLSKYFSLQLGSIESFVKNLSTRLSMERSITLVVDTSGILLVNDEKTRSFYGWRVRPTPSLLRILKHVDDTLLNYNQPTYYEPPIFHISIASISGDVSSQLNQSSEGDSGSENDDGGPAALKLNEVQCRFGTTKQYSIQLRDDL